MTHLTQKTAGIVGFPLFAAHYRVTINPKKHENIISMVAIVITTTLGGFQDDRGNVTRNKGLILLNIFKWQWQFVNLNPLSEGNASLKGFRVRCNNSLICGAGTGSTPNKRSRELLIPSLVSRSSLSWAVGNL